VGEDEAGCTGIQTVEVEGQQHVADGVNVQYNTTPPTSGNHYETPADPGFYPPATAAQIPEERFVHNLEHSQMVIWYQPAAPADVREDLEAYIDKQPGQQSIALLGVPYDQAPKPVTITAWGAMQTCEGISEDVLNAFRERFQGKGPEEVAPPFTP
jgi:hypothetical protein